MHATPPIPPVPSGFSRSVIPYPTTDDRATWQAYWEAQGQAWRTEPEIDKKRQKLLAAHRSTMPDITQNIYPFVGIKLSRADVEWLLATHEDGRGPIDWSDESQRNREGLDLRGADLSGENLSRLPLARLRAGRSWLEGHSPTPEQVDIAAAHMERADLREVHLEGGRLCHVNFQGAALYNAYLQEADLSEASMQNSTLYNAHLEGANLSEAHVERAYLFRAHLEEAILQGTFFDAASNFEHAFLCDEHGHRCVFLADVHWSNANISVIDWSAIRVLGDEYEARRHKLKRTEAENEEQLRTMRQEHLERYQTAVRANRQLAVALQSQGMNEDAARFAYRAQRLQRIVQRQRRRYGQFLFSLFLDLLAGYGYKLGRSFIAYLCVILGFAIAYYLVGPHFHIQLSPLEAIVFSMTSFHGRGFSPSQNIGLSNPLTVLAAIEAFVGLSIEVTFIATLTQRLFGK